MCCLDDILQDCHPFNFLLLIFQKSGSKVVLVDFGEVLGAVGWGLGGWGPGGWGPGGWGLGDTTCLSGVDAVIVFSWKLAIASRIHLYWENNLFFEEILKNFQWWNWLAACSVSESLNPFLRQITCGRI